MGCALRCDSASGRLSSADAASGQHGRYDPFVDEGAELVPFRLEAVDDGYELWLVDGDLEPVEDVFEEHDAENNGHGWQSLARWVVQAEMPELVDQIWFDSEAGMFVAGGSDQAALRRLANRLHAAFHDRELLSRLVAQAEAD